MLHCRVFSQYHKVLLIHFSGLNLFAKTLNIVLLSTPILLLPLPFHPYIRVKKLFKYVRLGINMAFELSQEQSDRTNLYVISNGDVSTCSTFTNNFIIHHLVFFLVVHIGIVSVCQRVLGCTHQLQL